jgi:hypothetical protein
MIIQELNYNQLEYLKRDCFNSFYKGDISNVTRTNK